MVQEFHVLRCFSCQSFQVQQVKKVNRWSCKLCGEKQSLLKEFGRGSGADCRRHVQKLNAMRGAMMEEQERNTWSLCKQVEADGENEPEERRDSQVTETQVSCWSKYLNSREEVEPEEEEANVLMGMQQLHGNMTDRKRKRRDGWTDRWTPEQTNWSSLKKPVRSSATTSPPSLNRASPPSLNHASPPSLNHARPPSLNHTRPPSLNRASPPSLNRASPPSLNHASPPSLNHARPPSLNHASPPSLNHASPPSLNHARPPSGSTGAVSRWACFISSDCQVNEEGAGPSFSGRGHSVGGAAQLSCNDIITQALPNPRPHPLLPVSLFQSEDEFSFNDNFLTAEF